MSIMYCLHTIQSAIHIIGYNIKLYNVNANCNDEIEIHNDSPYPNDDTFCMHYAPYKVAQTIGNEKNQLSLLSLNCCSINANCDSLNHLIYNVTSEHCRLDFIGLPEVFKIYDDFDYSIQGYHHIEYNIRDDADDGHGGVGLYVNSDMSYCRRDDLSRADIDVFTTELADITARINNENKESYIIGDFSIDLLKFQRYDKTKYFSESMLTTGYLPVITKPTTITEHSATLLDHIYR